MTNQGRNFEVETVVAVGGRLFVWEARLRGENGGRQADPLICLICLATMDVTEWDWRHKWPWGRPLKWTKVMPRSLFWRVKGDDTGSSRWFNAGSKLGQRLLRWPSFESALYPRSVFNRCALPGLGLLPPFVASTPARPCRDRGEWEERRGSTRPRQKRLIWGVSDVSFALASWLGHQSLLQRDMDPEDATVALPGLRHLPSCSRHALSATVPPLYGWKPK